MEVTLIVVRASLFQIKGIDIWAPDDESEASDDEFEASNESGTPESRFGTSGVPDGRSRKPIRGRFLELFTKSSPSIKEYKD